MEIYNNWWEEKRSAYLYGVLEKTESNILHQKLFADLKLAAEKQATMWLQKMNAQGLPPPSFTPDLRTRLVATLVKWLGAERMDKILAAMKIRGMSVFTQFHSEKKHISLTSSSNLRAAIFGVNDGLVSNMSLILGVTGGNANQHFVLLAGIAGLLAGACSMAAGEFISVRSQREVFEYQIAIEKEELEEYPEEEKEELSLIYQARNMPKEDANKLATFMIDHPQTGLATLAREELGLNPDDMVSPIGAMIYSFLSFSIGALIPLIPYLFGDNPWNLAISLAVTACALFIVGSILSLFSNRNPILLGLRMLSVGAIAGAITFVIGRWVGNVNL